MNSTEADVRTMMAAGSSDRPPGIDLLRGVRERRAPARPQPRYRLRALVSVGAVAVIGGGAALAATLTATVAAAPSAFAAVTAAAAATSAGGFRMTMDISMALPGSRPPLTSHVTGLLDPSRDRGEETVTGRWDFQVRFVGGGTYVHTEPGSEQVVYPAGPASKPWWELPAMVRLSPSKIDAAQVSLGETTTSPSALLGLLRSAGTVTNEGAASGPGWTGTKYGFTVTPGTRKAGRSTASGYVDVDGQGRVRRLVTTLTTQPAEAALTGPQPADGSAGTLTSTEDVTFSDFGRPVPVTAPPAAQVGRLTNPEALSGAGW